MIFQSSISRLGLLGYKTSTPYHSNHTSEVQETRGYIFQSTKIVNSVTYKFIILHHFASVQVLEKNHPTYLKSKASILNFGDLKMAERLRRAVDKSNSQFADQKLQY